MIIPVLGMDPSLTHWGMVKGNLNLITGEFILTNMFVIEPIKLNNKQVRVNSEDLFKAEQLAEPVIKACNEAKVIFAEVPVGSQSARAMASYGVCIGIIGTIRAMGNTIIEVTALESKIALAGKKSASKSEMIKAAMGAYPYAKWPIHKGKPQNRCEHMADGVAAIHAGVLTPTFQNLMKLYKEN